MITTFVLTNGMRVIVALNDKVPMVEVEIVYQFDPSAVPDGIPHLTEHLLFETTANIANGDMDRWFRQAGGSSAASTSWDEIRIRDLISSANLEWLVYIEAERSLRLCEGVTAENLENQRQVIANELFSSVLQANGDVADRLRRKSFSLHPALSKEVMGQIYNIESSNVEDICSFAEQWLQPSQATWIVSGDVEVERLQVLLLSYFPSEGVVSKNTIPIVENEQHRWYTESDQQRLLLVFAAPPTGSQAETISDAIIHTLSQPQTWNELSHMNHIQGWSENRDYGGWMVLSIETEHPQEALISLNQWLQEPKINWLDWQEQQQLISTRYMETNDGRVALLHSCVDHLSVERWEDCFTWQQEQYFKVQPLTLWRQPWSIGILSKRRGYGWVPTIGSMENDSDVVGIHCVC